MIVYTIKEYAAIFKLNQATVRNLIKQGKINNAVKIGSRWRIVEKEV